MYLFISHIFIISYLLRMFIYRKATISIRNQSPHACYYVYGCANLQSETHESHGNGSQDFEPFISPRQRLEYFSQTTMLDIKECKHQW